MAISRGLIVGVVTGAALAAVGMLLLTAPSLLFGSPWVTPLAAIAGAIFGGALTPVLSWLRR